MLSNCIDQLKAERKAIKRRIKQLKEERKVVRQAEKRYYRGQQRYLSDQYDRSQRRDLKNQFRHIKRQEKAALKRGECEAPLLAWPQNVTVVYVDATSLLCASDVLRHLALSHRNRSEKVLETIAREAVKLLNLDKCVLLLDRTSTFNYGEFICPLRTAGTSYVHDLMVQHAIENKNGGTANSVAFITSDPDLRLQLKNLGVNAMGPKTFLTFLAQKAQERTGTNLGLEGWIESLIVKQ
jgi:hypothetical protein